MIRQISISGPSQPMSFIANTLSPMENLCSSVREEILPSTLNAAGGGMGLGSTPVAFPSPLGTTLPPNLPSVNHL
jgi:hypothetical protein